MNDNFGYIIRNSKRETRGSTSRTQFDTRVALCIIRVWIEFVSIINRESISVNGLAISRGSCIVILMLRIAVCTEIEDDFLIFACYVSGATSGAEAVVEAVIGNTDRFDYDMSAICAGFCDGTFSGAGCICSVGFFEIVLAKIGHPTILHLRSVVVLTDDTINGNFVADSGLGCHCIVASFTVCTVSAVNSKGITGFIGDIHITILGVINIGDDTGYIVFVLGVLIRSIQFAQSICLLDGEHGICFGRNNF